jgi:hypothetical protein
MADAPLVLDVGDHDFEREVLERSQFLAAVLPSHADRLARVREAKAAAGDAAGAADAFHLDSAQRVVIEVDEWIPVC